MQQHCEHVAGSDGAADAGKIARKNELTAKMRDQILLFLREGIGREGDDPCPIFLLLCLIPILTDDCRAGDIGMETFGIEVGQIHTGNFILLILMVLVEVFMDIYKGIGLRIFGKIIHQ